MRRLAFAAAAALLWAGAPAPAATPEELWPVFDRLESAWAARDKAGYLALWDFSSTEARSNEDIEFSASPEQGQRRLVLERPSELPAAATRLRVSSQLVSILEPRGRVDQFVFVFEKRGERWAIVGRDPVGRVDGLVHLSLDPAGYRADGLRLQFEDFALEMKKGTLFTSPASLGPTVAVFVGEGTVRFRPSPPTEQEQLRQFCGRPELLTRVKSAFVRLHPADLRRVLVPNRLTPDPGAPERLAAARRFFDQNASRALILDANVLGSPWWVLPSLGDALVSFDAGRRGLLTFTVNSDQPEGIGLFDRKRRLQICLYPGKGRSTRYSEDDGRSVDILHHDLQVRFEPGEERVLGQDTLRLRLLAPVATVRLKLDERLEVESVTSAEGGRHLFFRVRGQDSFMVSLGPLIGKADEISLKIRYSGVLKPAAVESELQATLFDESGIANERARIEKMLVYSNRNAWYPQSLSDDYALASMRFETPLGYTVVTGGERVLARAEGQQMVVEYRVDDPGKYFTAVVGRLAAAGTKTEGPVHLSAFGGGRTRDEAAKSLDLAAAMLRFFSERFGPCPYSYLNLVVIEGQTPGGHAPPGMVVLARRPLLFRKSLRDDPTNFSDVAGFFLAHEIAHQWWGQGVAGQNYRERWLSEGQAQYAAALWAREAYGEERFRGILRRMGRWARRETHKGPIHLGYRIGHVKGDTEAYRALVYDKAAYVLHMLSRVVGESAFSAGLRAFQERFRFRKAGTDDLRESLEAASGRDLEGYFDQWVRGTELPSLVVKTRTEPAAAGFLTRVEIRPARPLPGPLPLEISLVSGRGGESRRLSVPAEGGRFDIESTARPDRIEINADLGLLAEIQR